MFATIERRDRSARSAGLIRCWYVRIPAAINDLFPRLAWAMGDGLWLAAWRRTAAWAPVLVLVVGLLVPRTWPGTVDVYTESPLFVGLAAAVSVLSGTLGVALLTGHGVREVLSHDVASGLNATLHEGGAWLVGWLLLAVLVVIVPQVSHLLAEVAIVRMPSLRDRDLRAAVRAIALAVVYPAAVLLWCQAMTLLVRPVFTWTGAAPTLAAAWGLQRWWPWLAAAAAAAALARGTLEGLVAPRLRLAGEVGALRADRARSWPAAPPSWPAIFGTTTVVPAAAWGTLLLAGTFGRFTDAALAVAALVLFGMLGRGLAGWLTGEWAYQVGRVPAPVRIATAIGLGYALTVKALVVTWATDESQWAMMVGILLTLALLLVLFPFERSIDAGRARHAP